MVTSSRWGDPKAIYQRPANLFVATFIGRSNILKGKILQNNGQTVLKLEGVYDIEMPNIIPEQQKIRKSEFRYDRKNSS